MTKLRNFIGDEKGATAIEFGLITAYVTIAIIAAVTSIGSSIDNNFSNDCTVHWRNNYFMPRPIDPN